MSVHPKFDSFEPEQENDKIIRLPQEIDPQLEKTRDAMHRSLVQKVATDSLNELQAKLAENAGKETRYELQLLGTSSSPVAKTESAQYVSKEALVQYASDPALIAPYQAIVKTMTLAYEQSTYKPVKSDILNAGIKLFRQTVEKAKGASEHEQAQVRLKALTTLIDDIRTKGNELKKDPEFTLRELNNLRDLLNRLVPFQQALESHTLESVPVKYHKLQIVDELKRTFKKIIGSKAPDELVHNLLLFYSLSPQERLVRYKDQSARSSIQASKTQLWGQLSKEDCAALDAILGCLKTIHATKRAYLDARLLGTVSGALIKREQKLKGLTAEAATLQVKEKLGLKEYLSVVDLVIATKNNPAAIQAVRVIGRFAVEPPFFLKTGLENTRELLAMTIFRDLGLDSILWPKQELSFFGATLSQQKDPKVLASRGIEGEPIPVEIEKGYLAAKKRVELLEHAKSVLPQEIDELRRLGKKLAAERKQKIEELASEKKPLVVSKRKLKMELRIAKLKAFFKRDSSKKQIEDIDQRLSELEDQLHALDGDINYLTNRIAGIQESIREKTSYLKSIAATAEIEKQKTHLKTVMHERNGMQSRLSHLRSQKKQLKFPLSKQRMQINKEMDSLKKTIALQDDKILQGRKELREMENQRKHRSSLESAHQQMEDAEKALSQLTTARDVQANVLAETIIQSYDAHINQKMVMQKHLFDLDTARFFPPALAYTSGDETFVMFRSALLDHPDASKPLSPELVETIKSWGSEIPAGWEKQGLKGDPEQTEKDSREIMQLREEGQFIKTLEEITLVIESGGIKELDEDQIQELRALHKKYIPWPSPPQSLDEESIKIIYAACFKRKDDIVARIAEIKRKNYQKIHPRAFEEAKARMLAIKDYVDECEKMGTSPTAKGAFFAANPLLKPFMQFLERAEGNPGTRIGFEVGRENQVKTRSLENIITLAKSDPDLNATPAEIAEMEEALAAIKAMNLPPESALNTTMDLG